MNFYPKALPTDKPRKGIDINNEFFQDWEQTKLKSVTIVLFIILSSYCNQD